MPQPTRQRCRFNTHIQWFEPPIITAGIPHVAPDSLQITADGVTGVAPELWGIHLAGILDRIWTTEVGQAVMTSVRKRTTIYPTNDAAQTDPDPFEDSPLDAEEVMMPVTANGLATTVGMNALIWFNVNRRVEYRDGAATRTPDATLVHELMHAVNITWGNRRTWDTYDEAERQRRQALSPEEECAWVIGSMYRSERDDMWLRDNYLGDELLPPGTRRLGEEYVLREVVSNCKEHVPTLASQLAHIDARTCGFNPFRRFARLPVTARP